MTVPVATAIRRVSFQRSSGIPSVSELSFLIVDRRCTLARLAEAVPPIRAREIWPFLRLHAGRNSSCFSTSRCKLCTAEDSGHYVALVVVRRARHLALCRFVAFCGLIALFIIAEAQIPPTAASRLQVVNARPLACVKFHTYCCCTRISTAGCRLRSVLFSFTVQ